MRIFKLILRRLGSIEVVEDSKAVRLDKCLRQRNHPPRVCVILIIGEHPPAQHKREATALISKLVFNCDPFETIQIIQMEERFVPTILLSDVKFPYPQRKPIQNRMTSKILEAIQRGKDCLVESATGTGKTLCLLSACLTAQLTPQEGVSRVYYLTRTHSQMECIVKQFQELGYSDVRFSLKQSKKGLCGNSKILDIGKHCNYQDFEKVCDLSKRREDVAEGQEGRKKGTKLSKLESKEKSQLRKQNKSKPQRPKSLAEIEEMGVPYCPFKISDLEQPLEFYNPEQRYSTKAIKLMATSQGLCPYSVESQLSKHTELVIMSYKYLLDPLLFQRTRIGPELLNSVVIFDEAHNVINIAKDESSVHLHPNYSKVLDHIGRTQEKFQEMFDKGENRKEYVEAFQVLDDLRKFVAGMELISECFDTELKRLRRDPMIVQHDIMLVEPKEFQKVFEQSSMVDYLSYYTEKAEIINSLDKVLPSIEEKESELFADEPQQQEKKQEKPDRAVHKKLIASFTKFCYMLARLIRNQEIYDNFLIALETKRSRSGKIQLTDINFVCLSSKYAFGRLKSCGIRTMVFASGTLSEEEFKDTGLQFVKYFQNENHLERSRIRTFLLKKYKKEQEKVKTDACLKITTNNQQEQQIVEILQRLIVYIPHGVLVFFKSYSHLTLIKQYMIRNKISFEKHIYWEQQKNKSEFERDVREYTQNAQSKLGAIFMAVCRGKLSEGYNFKDNLARAVFVVGSPLINLDCLQYRVQQYIHKDSKKLSEWYYRDASVAINQAAGRLIRHTEDFGCLYLLGQMACSKRKLPIWIRECPIFDQDETLFWKVVKETDNFMKLKADKMAQCKQVEVQRVLDDPSSEEDESQPIEQPKGNNCVNEPALKMEVELDEEEELLLVQMMNDYRKNRPTEEEPTELPVKKPKLEW